MHVRDRRRRAGAGRRKGHKPVGEADQRRAQSVPSDRELGASCRTDASGARPARSTSIRTAPASGSRSVAAQVAPAVAHRIPARRSHCGDSTLDPILKFDASGKLLKSFGAGILLFPHGMHVDRDGNVWVTDGARPRRQGASGLQVQPRRQAAADARQGRRRRAAAPTSSMRRPRSSIAPNGDIFVADGHGGDTNARIVKFDKDGKFIKTWGKKGTGPGEFDIPHALAMDSQRPAVRRRPQQQPHPDLRSGRQLHRPSGSSSAGRAASSSTATTSSMSPIPNPSRSRRTTMAGSAASASAASATAR